MPETVLADPLRLESLYKSGLLDSPAERVFDRITELTCRLLNVPVSLVSLVDDKRQFFKSAQGLAEPLARERQTPLSHSFCQYVVNTKQPLIAQDARNHPLLCDNLAIRDLSIISYLGIPLLLPDGQVAGSLCAIDSKPRTWSQTDVETLTDLAQAVMAEFKVRNLLQEKTVHEAKVRKQEEQLQLASDIARMGIFEWDLLTNKFDVNDTLHQFYGSESGQEVTLEKFLSLIHPEDLPGMQSGLSVLAEVSQPSTLEFRIGLPTGVRWIQSKSRLIYNDRGEPVKLVGVNFDITEQKELQLTLAESEAKFIRIFETASVNMTLTSLSDMTIVEANQRFMDDFGLTRADVLGKNIESIIHWVDYSERNRYINILKTKGKVENFEAVVRTHDGEIKTHVLSSEIIKIKDRLYVLSSGANITELKSIEQALKEEKERYRLISTVASDYMFSADVSADGTMQTKWVTDAFAKTTGYTLSDLDARGGWRSIVHPDDLAQDAKDIATLIKNQNVYSEVRIIHKHGHVVWVRNHIHPIWDSEQHRVIRVYGAVQDITERKQIELTLRQSEERFVELFQQSPYTKTITDLDTGLIVDVNQTFIQRTGFSREEAIGKTTKELGLWVSPERRDELVKLVKLQGKVSNFEVETRSRSGELRVGLSSAFMLEIQGKRLLVVSTRDITAEKKAQIALKESEEKFTQMFNLADANLLLIKQSDLTILEVNEHFLQEFGLSRVEVIGAKVTNLYSWVDEEREQQFDTLFQTQGAVYDFEARFHIRSGGIQTHVISAVITNINGEPCILNTGRNITALKDMELSLRESEQKFSKLFKRSPVAVSLTNLRTQKIVEANRKFFELSGYSREEIIGKTSQDLQAWNDPKKREDFLKTFMKQGFVSDVEASFFTKDRQEKNVLVSAEVIELEGESFMISTVQDITEQRKVEATLRNSEEKFAQLFHQSPAAIVVRSLPDQRIIDLNEAAVQLAGHTREDLIGKSAEELTEWLDPEQLEKFTYLIETQGKVTNFEAYIRMPNKTTSTLLVSAEISEIDRQKVLISTIIDITARRNAEKALVESEARFEKIFQNSPFGVLLIDIDAERIIDVNEQFIHDTGYSREEVLSTSDFSSVLWVSPEQQQEARRILFNQGYLKDYTLEFRRKSGETGWAQTSAEFFELGGKLYLISTNRDVTGLRQMEQNLHDERNLLRTLIDALPDYIAVKDRNSRMILANKSTITHMQKTPDSIIGTTDYDFYPKHLADEYIKKEQHVIYTGEPLLNHEEENITPEGKPQWVITTKVPLVNQSGDIVGLVGSSRDITDLKHAENALRESEERYRIVAETASDAIVTIDHNSVIHYLNPGTEYMFGYTEQELLNHKITLLMPDYLRTLHETAMKHYLETGIKKHDWSGLEVTGQHKDGHEIPLEISFSQFFKDGKSFFTGIIRDVSERKLLLTRLEQMAYRDALTSLPNRAMLRERLDYLLKQDLPTYGLALLFIDLDNFKIINDSLGHEYGDEVLKVIANRLGDTIRSDDMVARLGGDEFVVLLNGTGSSDDIAKIAQKILACLENPIRIQHQDVQMGGSMGIALYPQDGRTSTDLLRSADLAMYQAKKEKNVFKFYTGELNERIQERLSLENDLRVALANHDVRVHYQPRIDLVTGQITGAEALARWVHPQKGFISPGRFIPIAEESGLIHSLGLDILNQACSQLKQWQQQGYPYFRVSVNLAPQQLYHPSLIDNIRDILEQTGLEPSYLELEVTESGAMNSIKESLPILQALRDLGMHIAVDDFGTGYSSLSYLQRLPIDSLKIDRSFLLEIGSQERNGEAIARVITSLGKNLGLNVVAEGIETTQQLKFLMQIQCDEAQGFLFSKPLPAHEFEHYLMTQETKNLLLQFKQNHPTLFS